MRTLIRFRWRAVVVALAIGCVVAAVPAVSALAAPDNRVVALAFDADTNTLIKAEADGLYRRAEEGGEWVRLPLPPGTQQGRITTMAFSTRPPHMLYVAGHGFGVLRSSDGGRTWIAKSEGLPGDDIAALTVHADQAATVYAYAAGKGIFRSEDGGDHWRLMDTGPREAILQFVHSNMPGSMQTGWLFAATAKGVARSMDCFCGWRDAGALGRPVAAVAYDPQALKRVYAATPEGLFVSEDGGEQWTAMHAPERMTALITTPRGALIAADSTGTLFWSSDHGTTWRAIAG